MTRTASLAARAKQMITHALTRGIPDSYQRATVEVAPEEPIDLDQARTQHSHYIAALRTLGINVIEMPADNRFPDSCFVEDCVLFHNGVALITNSGAPSRRGEEIAVKTYLEDFARIESMALPATLDGGDCLRIENRIYVGQSARTNSEGIARVREVFEPLGLEVVSVPVRGALHLKSLCSYLGDGVIVLAEDSIPASTFVDVDTLIVPREEKYAANCLAVKETVLCSKGYPHTHAAIKAAGFSIIPLVTSEIRKGDGSLTCLSILF
jgi:dimethylargininase